MKGFRSSHPPFPSFAWRTHIHRRQKPNPQICVGVSDRRTFRAINNFREIGRAHV
jgi:hypothetical protein